MYGYKKRKYHTYITFYTNITLPDHGWHYSYCQCIKNTAQINHLVYNIYFNRNIITVLLFVIGKYRNRKTLKQFPDHDIKEICSEYKAKPFLVI